VRVVRGFPVFMCDGLGTVVGGGRRKTRTLGDRTYVLEHALHGDLLRYQGVEGRSSGEPGCIARLRGIFNPDGDCADMTIAEVRSC